MSISRPTSELIAEREAFTWGVLVGMSRVQEASFCDSEQGLPTYFADKTPWKKPDDSSNKLDKPIETNT